MIFHYLSSFVAATKHENKSRLPNFFSKQVSFQSILRFQFKCPQARSTRSLVRCAEYREMFIIFAAQPSSSSLHSTRKTCRTREEEALLEQSVRNQKRESAASDGGPRSILKNFHHERLSKCVDGLMNILLNDSGVRWGNGQRARDAEACGIDNHSHRSESERCGNAKNRDAY